MARPTKADKLENVGTRVPAEMAQELSSISEQHDRAVSWVLRKFIQRGMNAYKKDGLFDDPEGSATKLTKHASGSLKPKRKPDFDRTHVFAKTGKPMSERDEQVILDDMEKEEEEEKKENPDD